MAEKWPRFGGATAKLAALGGPWTGWIGSAPVQISGCGLDDTLSWWCDELLLVVVVLRLSFVPRGREIRLLATKGIPLQIAMDREKGRASWRQVGLPAQSLPRRRFRRVLRAFICTFCMRVCIYVYVCMCADMYIYIYVHVCMYMYMYAFIHMCLCLCMHICALIVSPCISVSACGRCDGCACVFVYICMRMHMGVGIHICVFFLQ